MPSRSIILSPRKGNVSITAINCGGSTPRLGGVVDVSDFPNLTSFSCNNNNITAISGYSENSNLEVLSFIDNLLVDNLPDLSGMTNLRDFRYNRNQISGPIPPSLNALTSLQIYIGHNNAHTGSIPSLNNLTNLQQFFCDLNNLTGTIPALNNNINLQDFRCHSQKGSIKLTGNIPNLTANTLLQRFYCYANQLSGPIPSLTGLTALRDFDCGNNALTFIPSLTGLTALQNFDCGNNELSNTIPSLTGLTALQNFNCGGNQLTGSIPSLTGLNNLLGFYCYNNALSNFAGGSVSNKLGDFQAQNNLLPASAVDSILAAFVAANKTTGTRVLNLHGTGNAAPTNTGVIKTSLAGSAFSRVDTTVTVTTAPLVLGFTIASGDYITITDITEPDFQGTFSITKIDDTTFTYTTVSSGALTGSGTATLRQTSTGNTSGFRNYQNLALVSRTGGAWSVNINFPA